MKIKILFLVFLAFLFHAGSVDAQKRRSEEARQNIGIGRPREVHDFTNGHGRRACPGRSQRFRDLEGELAPGRRFPHASLHRSCARQFRHRTIQRLAFAPREA